MRHFWNKHKGWPRARHQGLKLQAIRIDVRSLGRLRVGSRLLVAFRRNIVGSAEFAQRGCQRAAIKTILDPLMTFGLQPGLDVADCAAGTAFR